MDTDGNKLDNDKFISTGSKTIIYNKKVRTNNKEDYIKVNIKDY